MSVIFNLIGDLANQFDEVTYRRPIDLRVRATMLRLRWALSMMVLVPMKMDQVLAPDIIAHLIFPKVQ